MDGIYNILLLHSNVSDQQVIHRFGWDTRLLAEVIFSSLQDSRIGGNKAGCLDARAYQIPDDPQRPIGLILGIMDSGCSYILATQAQMTKITIHAQQRDRTGYIRSPIRPDPANFYASLSPISFESTTSLHAKMKTYEQKKRKGGRSGPLFDNSAANKNFGGYNPARAAFEHQRSVSSLYSFLLLIDVLARLLYAAIDNPFGPDEIHKFCLKNPPYWIASTSFVALLPETWNGDTYEKAETDPTILSLRLASVPCLTVKEDNYPSNIAYHASVRVRETKSKQNQMGSTQVNLAWGLIPCLLIQSFVQEILEMTRQGEIGERLRTFFASIDSKQAFLLVFNAKKTLTSLAKLGVDVNSYTQGINELFRGSDAHCSKPDVKNENKFTASGTKRYDPEHSRHTRDPYERDQAQGYRRRSASPRQRISLPKRDQSPPLRYEDKEDKMEVKEDQMTEPEPEDVNEDEEDGEAPPPAKVFVVDVQSMYLVMSKLDIKSVKGLKDLSRRLGIEQGNENTKNDC
jgi:hypothetical protein